MGQFMSYPKVFIIILNWNGLEDTLECLESVTALNYQNYKVIVVDNGSVENPHKVIADKYPDVKLVLNEENLGYTGGNNSGIRYALQQGAEYVWLLNNDTAVESDALTNLVTEVEKHPSTGIAGSKIYYFDFPTKIWFAGSHIDWCKASTPHHGMGKTDLGQYDSVKEVERVTGCSMLVKKAVCDKIGLLDENFFLYAEEVDWCVRAGKAGFKCIFVPSSVIYHKISASVSKAGGYNSVFGYYNTRNFLYLIKKSFAFPIREAILLKVIFSKMKFEKRNLLRALISLILPSFKLKPCEDPILFAIRDFFIKKMGKAEYKF